MVAAYRFKGVATEQEALTNVNEGTAYALTVTGAVTWTTGKGLFFPAEVNCYITNTELTNQYASIVSCTFGYSDMSTGNVVTAGVVLLAWTGSGYFLIAKGGIYISSTATYYKHITGAATTDGTIKTSGSVHSGGVLSANWLSSGNTLYYNGLSQSTSSGNAKGLGNLGWTPGRVFTTCKDTNLARGTMYLSALVFYNTVLTDAQHVQLANQINAL